MILRRISLLVNGCEEPEYIAPIAKNLTYNGSSQELLTAGSTNDGTIYYSIDNSTWNTTVPSGTNADSYTVYWKLVGDEGWCNVEPITINVTIAKADATYTAPTAKSLTYNGSAQALLNAGAVTGGTIQYSDDNTTWVTNIPSSTNANTYTSYWRIVGDGNHNDKASASINTTISPKTVSSPAITLSQDSYVYSNTAYQPTPTVKDGSITIESSEYTVTYSDNINAGTATCTITDKSGGNYTVSGSKTFTIAKVTPTVVAPTAKVLTYNGSAQELINAGSTDYGTLQYKVSSDSWSTNIPTRTRGGSYTVQYKVVGDSNINDVAAQSVQCSINEKQVTATVTLSQTAYTYNGSACEPNVTVSDGGVIIDPSEYTVTYSNNVNAGTGTVTISDNVGGDYEVIGSSTFTINKANSSLSFAVTDITVEVGEVSSNVVTVNAGDGTVTYSSNNTSAVTVDNNGSITGVSVGNATITVNISSTNNYNSASTSYTSSCVEVIIAKFNVTSTTSPTRIASATTNFSAIEIDGVEQPSVTTGYTFSATGEHTVKYILNGTSIGDSAFYGCSSLTSIDIPDSVTTIGKYAFFSCSGLTSIDIPDNVTSIGQSAFDGCSGLTSIDIPDNVTSVGADAFAYCSGLTSITVEATTPPTLGTNVFYSTNNYPIYVPCDSVDTYKAATNWSTYSSRIQAIPGSCPLVVKFNVTSTSSPTRILSSVTNVSSILIDGVEQPSVTTGYTFSTTGEHTVKYVLIDKATISNNTFCDCTAITSVVVPDSVTTIGINAFFGCIILTNIVIPNSVTSIGGSAFFGCIGLTSCTIGSGVTAIGSQAFYNCTGLTSIIVNTITPPTFGTDVFNNTNDCPIYVSTCSLVNTYKSASGWNSYSSRITALDCPPITATFSVTDTSNPTRILSSTTNVSKVYIDDVEQPSVTTGYTFSTTGEHTVKYYLRGPKIGNYAFYDCRSLTSIDIPDSVTRIGDYAFQSCSGITSCTIGSGVISIGGYAFSGCSSLTSITIPSGVTSIGEGICNYCTGLISILVSSENTVYDSRNGCNAIIETSTNILIQGCKNTAIPNNITSIGNSAFQNCRSLTSITIPDSVTSIGKEAFEYCYSLTSCTIGSGVTSIGASAFYYCSGLTSCTIGSGVTSIGNSAFYGCSGLTSITIPDSVTNIGGSAFFRCSGLTSCTIGSGVTAIGSQAFYQCSGLTSIVSNAITAPTIQSNTFRNVKTGGTLIVRTGSTGYDVWMGTSNYYLGKYNWTKVEQ